MADFADRLYCKMLVVRCQLGNPKAFEELVARCHPKLHGFIHKMLPSYQGVEDLTQEVWMDVFNNIAKLADPSAFLPWLYRIARSRVFRMLRKMRQPMMSIGEIEPIDEK